MLFRKNAEIQQLNCEPTPEGNRLICQVLIVTKDGEVLEDRVYANMPQVKVKKGKKGYKIDYGD